MKRLSAFLTILLLLMNTAAALAADDPLASIAVEIGAALRRLAASPDYAASVGAASGEIAQLCAELGKGDTQPSRILCYTFDRSEDMRRLREESNDLAARLSDWELENLLDRMTGSFAAQLNAYQGVEALAAASLLTYGKAAAVPDISGCRLYVLEYDHGMPVMVSVLPGDGAVSLSSSFLLNPDWQDLLPDMLSAHPLLVE